MYHASTYSDLGANNVVVEKMLDKVIACDLAKDHATAHRLLCLWEEMIREDFDSRNKHIQHADEQNLVEVVNQQSTILKELCKQ
jgi:hypothetical protein